MTSESVSATTSIQVGVEVVFALLIDPTRHAAIDGTGGVCDAIEPRPITASGQIFRMRMFLPMHPDGIYEIHNQVLDFERNRSISWRPGFLEDAASGQLGFGGWIWRYDLATSGAHACEVTHTYDWSAVGPGPRRHLEFPPFPDDHLANSLNHLADMATGLRGAPPSAP